MLKFSVLILLMSAFLFQGCSKEVQSKTNFKFKPAPDNSAGMKFAGEVISSDSLYKGIESEIYEQEKKLFDLKMDKIKAVILEKLVNSDPRKKNLTNDQFLEQYITKGLKVKKEQIDAFIKERNIPKEHQTAELSKRVEKFLMIDEKKKAVDRWVAEKTAKMDIEVYLKEPMRPTFNVNIGDAPIAGGKDAKVTIVEFSDFQCPFCSKGAKIVDKLKKKYGNKIKVAFKNFPLPFHNQAKGAAVAGLCANDQGSDKFWKMHDMMFENQTKLDKTGLKELAKQAKLDLKKFSECLDKNTYLAKVDQDMNEGKKVGVKSTPTFFVNGMLINGAQPVEVFSELIDKELGM